MLQIIGHIHKLQRKLSAANTTSGIVFTTLHILRNLQMDPIIVCHGKPFKPRGMLHNGLIGPFISYDENEVLRIQPQRKYSQQFIFCVTNK
jgi:hypothetical protein